MGLWILGQVATDVAAGLTLTEHPQTFGVVTPQTIRFEHDPQSVVRWIPQSSRAATCPQFFFKREQKDESVSHGQSSSLFAVHPGGQQPSPDAH